MLRLVSETNAVRGVNRNVRTIPTGKDSRENETLERIQFVPLHLKY